MQPRARLEDEVRRGLEYALDERLAPHYERHIVEGCGYRTPDVVAGALGLAAAPNAQGPAPIWLDLGAGTGLVGQAAMRRGLRLELVAVDISDAMLRQIDCPGYSARRCADAVVFLPFADATFDGVVAAGMLEHVIEPARVFLHAARVVKPGGAFVFTFPPNRAGWGPGEARDGLVSHDPVSIRASLASFGLSVTHETSYPAYMSGSNGWLDHHLVSGVRDGAR